MTVLYDGLYMHRSRDNLADQINSSRQKRFDKIAGPTSLKP